MKIINTSHYSPSSPKNTKTPTLKSLSYLAGIAEKMKRSSTLQEFGFELEGWSSPTLERERNESLWWSPSLLY
jgi:hypothetical protein